MDQHQERSAIESKLARCGRLAKDFPDDPAAKHFRELAEQLEAEIRALDEKRTPS